MNFFFSKMYVDNIFEQSWLIQSKVMIVSNHYFLPHLKIKNLLGSFCWPPAFKIFPQIFYTGNWVMSVGFSYYCKKYIYLFDCAKSSLQHIGSSVFVGAWTLLLCHGILVPQSRIKPRSPALGARSLCHWITRKVPFLHCCVLFFPFEKRHS